MSGLGNSAMPECCLPGDEAIGARLINGSGLRRLLLNGIVPSSYVATIVRPNVRWLASCASEVMPLCFN